MSSVGVAQALGRRERQEDAADVLLGQDGDPYLLVLSDGMGGAAAGDLAASMIVQTVREVFQENRSSLGPRLKLACEMANRALASAVISRPSQAGMGGTLVALAPSPRGLWFISVGDSLLLRWRAGRLDRINADHSIGGALDRAVQKGLVSAEEAAAAFGRSRITSALTGASLDLMRIDEPVGPLDYRPGDFWIVASDGLATLSMSEISGYLSRASSAQDAADFMINAVESKADPNQDNTSVVIWAV